MTANIVTHQRSTLPPELWAMILPKVCSSREDLLHLWLRCRQVSRFFRHEIENLVATECLPRTFIRFWLTPRRWNARAKGYDYLPYINTSYLATDIIATFNSIAEDGSNAIFRLATWTDGEVFTGSHLRILQKLEHFRLRINVIVECNESPFFLCNSSGDMEVDWQDLFTAMLAGNKTASNNGPELVNQQVRFTKLSLMHEADSKYRSDGPGGLVTTSSAHATSPRHQPRVNRPVAER